MPHHERSEDWKSLRRWKARAVRAISEQVNTAEGQILEAKELGVLSYINPLENFRREVEMYGNFLSGLADEIERHPDSVLATTSTSSMGKEKNVPISSPENHVIFIVHGHDEVNLHRLEKLLKEHFMLNCKILSSDAGSGRTLIEKFEQEARKAEFAFVLLTPDDQINGQGLEYKQARPNVIFELGWFYGKLGRERVCVLRSKSTKIHSDLEGISRIEFDKVVNEKVEEIQRELIAAGLLKA